MKMNKRKFRIGELAKKLKVERFVIRFWEKEFGVKSSRSKGGQRFYEEKDLELFKHIKTLLYDQGFTIAGAKKNLKDHKKHIIASQKTTMGEEPQKEDTEKISEQVIVLQKQLMKLRELL